MDQTMEIADAIEAYDHDFGAVFDKNDLLVKDK